MTGTYSVAIYTVGEDNKIHIVRADSPAQAIIKAIMQEGESKSLEILGNPWLLPGRGSRL